MYASLASSNSPVAMTLGWNSFFHFLILHTACCNNVKPAHFSSTQFNSKYGASKSWISHKSAVVTPVRLCKRVVPIWTWWPIHSDIHLSLFFFFFLNNNYNDNLCFGLFFFGIHLCWTLTHLAPLGSIHQHEGRGETSQKSLFQKLCNNLKFLYRLVMCCPCCSTHSSFYLLSISFSLPSLCPSPQLHLRGIRETHLASTTPL